MKYILHAPKGTDFNWTVEALCGKRVSSGAVTWRYPEMVNCRRCKKLLKEGRIAEA